MKLGVFRTDDSDRRIGRIDGDTVVDVTDAVGLLETALQRMTDGETIAAPDNGTTHSLSKVQLLPPTTSENETFAIALNYAST